MTAIIRDSCLRTNFSSVQICFLTCLDFDQIFFLHCFIYNVCTFSAIRYFPSELFFSSGQVFSSYNSPHLINMIVCIFC